MVRYINDELLQERLTDEDGLTGVAFLEYESKPCVHFMPELDSVAETFGGRIPFYKIDVGENPDVTETLNVQAVPTLLLFRDGAEIARYEGPYNRKELIERINNTITRE